MNKLAITDIWKVARILYNLIHQARSISNMNHITLMCYMSLARFKGLITTVDVVMLLKL